MNVPNEPNAERAFARRMLWLLLLMAIAGGLAEFLARYSDLTRFGTPLLHTPDYRRDLTVHDSLGIRGRPSGAHKRFKLNSAGFRSPESTLVARGGCPTVAVLGASETFGYEERAGKEYPAQLADSLARWGCYQVINAAITGASILASRQLWNLWVSRFSPTIVVVYLNPLQFLGEDSPTPPKRLDQPRSDDRSPRPRLLDVAEDLIVYPAFVQRRRIVRMIESLERGREESWFLPRVPEDRLRDFIAAVDSTVMDIEQRGGRPLLVFHAMRDTSLSSERARFGFESARQFGARARSETMVAFDSAAQAVVIRYANDRNVAFLNLRPLMSGEAAYFADVVHFSELGASRVAHHLAAALAGSNPEKPLVTSRQR